MVARKLIESTTNDSFSWVWILVCSLIVMGMLLVDMDKTQGSLVSASRPRATRKEKGKGKSTLSGGEEELKVRKNHRLIYESTIVAKRVTCERMIDRLSLGKSTLMRQIGARGLEFFFELTSVTPNSIAAYFGYIRPDLENINYHYPKFLDKSLGEYVEIIYEEVDQFTRVFVQERSSANYRTLK
ncbi:unnamed protein product, partial [Ilex paraguariensis]